MPDSVFHQYILSAEIATTIATTKAASKKIIGRCPQCGTDKKTGKVTCCVGGGAWVGKCGNAGDSKFEHTWSEGIEACKGKFITNSK